MSKKTDSTIVISLKEISITTCLVTVLSSTSAYAANPELTQANENLQKIFNRMKEKYSAHDAQQAQLAAQTQAAKNVPDTAPTSQTFDADIADQGFIDGGDADKT